jgi:ATP-binding cassette subfamily B protein
MDEFVQTLPQQYNTRIGSGGLAVSHGQRQRLGLARALFQQRPLLVLDEATAALDLVTEASIVHAIKTHRPDLTVVLITHRLDSLQHCQRVYRFKRGRVNLMSEEQLSAFTG